MEVIWELQDLWTQMNLQEVNLSSFVFCVLGGKAFVKK